MQEILEFFWLLITIWKSRRVFLCLILDEEWLQYVIFYLSTVQK